jgi:hemerythrin superfamily protein
MNAIELLKADHARVQALFRQYEAAGNQAQSQREIAEQIFTELEVHASLEEELFYPAVRAPLETVIVEEEPADETDEGEDADLIAQALEEHQEVKTLIAALRALDPGDAQFQVRFTELREGVEEHVGMEEDELMPTVAAALGSELERIRGCTSCRRPVALRSRSHASASRGAEAPGDSMVTRAGRGSWG